MEIINRRQRMNSVARKLRRDGSGERTIGLIPTMGALHEGHLSLVREARRMCDYVVVSIFVNPAQFGANEDFAHYPRRLTEDTAMLTDYNVDYIFAPPNEEIYPRGFSTYVTVEGLSNELEGAARPGHFRGVTTVVALLLNIIRPDFAYFGQKDAQQTIVIKRMVRDLAIDTEIVVLPIIREASGLAMSSRNAYLNPEQKHAAAALYAGLQAAARAFASGEHSAKRLIEIVRVNVAREPGVQLEYVAITDTGAMKPMEKLDGDHDALVSLAARVGSIRLIDNIVLSPAKRPRTATT